MTGGKDRHFTFQEHDISRKNLKDAGRYSLVKTPVKAYAGLLVTSTGEENDRGSSGRAKSVPSDGRGDRSHADKGDTNAGSVEPGTERLCERDVHRERPQGFRDGVDRFADQWERGETTPTISTAILGAPADNPTKEPAVLTITDKLKALAQRARSKCPDDCCQTCYNKYCRVLYKTCCVCTGSINLSDKQKLIP